MPPVDQGRAAQVKPSVLNANAKMGRHHRQACRHHRFHKHMGALKTHQFSSRSSTRARHQARLRLIRGRGLIHIAPPRPADIRPGPRPLLPQWRRAGAVLRRSRKSESAEMRIPFRRADGLERLGRQAIERRVALGDIGKARGDPAAADRARGLRGQRRQQKHHLYRRSRRRQPAISRPIIAPNCWRS